MEEDRFTRQKRAEGRADAIPLVLLVVVVLVVLFRGKPPRAETVCPDCNARVNAPAHIAEFNCPACGRRLEVGAGGDVRRLA
ncbi:MAG: hypothetical protein LC795_10370 [Acidobacteria bacterium]|nr:hypothetical protein [Acidobacteriota bacterium]